MSQQAAAGQGTPAAGCAGRAGHFKRGQGDPPTKSLKSAISAIANETFNTGQNRFAAQFTQSRQNVANYLQRTAADEGYLVTETIRTGKEQIIALPPAVDPNAMDADDQKIIREEAVRAIAMRKVKLEVPGHAGEGIEDPWKLSSCKGIPFWRSKEHERRRRTSIPSARSSYGTRPRRTRILDCR